MVRTHHERDSTIPYYFRESLKRKTIGSARGRLIYKSGSALVSALDLRSQSLWRTQRSRYTEEKNRSVVCICRRNKRADDHAKVGRDITNSSHHPMGIALPPRKSSRLAESALSSGESTTGDSSQQSQNSQRSQRSVVYLHAATGWSIYALHHVYSLDSFLLTLFSSIRCLSYLLHLFYRC